MNKIGLSGFVFLLAGALLATGCEKTRNVIGLDKQSPDEFAVVPRAPLSVPPDYGLRPPTPGAQRPQEQTVRNQARDILLDDARANSAAAAREAAASGKVSLGEASLLARAGALNTGSSIRSVVDRENTAMVQAAESVFNKVFFWRESDPPGTVVDAEKESRRLREASANGDPPNKGDVPVIKRRERGILEGLF